MVILGINYVFHDSSVCIVVNGELIAAVEEERFTRSKHTGAFPHQSIDKCLAIAGLTLQDVDHIALSFKPTLDVGKKLVYGLRHLRRWLAIFQLQLLRFYWRYRTINRWYRTTFSGDHQPQLHWVSHHESHVVGSFLVSPYEKAALLSLDGSGEWSTGYLGYGEGINITHYSNMYFPHSMGSIYEAVTAFCGFKPMYDEGKTMGLAPMGNPETFIDEARKVVSVTPEGQIDVDLSYFGFQGCQHQYFSPKFFAVFGQPRKRNAAFQQHHMDVAAAFQQVLEEVALALCQVLRQKTDADYLVIAGGVALNSVMNGRLVRESGFKDVYVMPAAGDNGTAIGAAYYVHHCILDHPRCYVHNDPYLGCEYDNALIEGYLKECKLPYQYYADIEKKAAELLANDQIIGWFQGRAEIGPRALGNRSILADPTKPHMKDKINAEVKHREAYRPFAPSVVVEERQTYFDMDVEAPFMLKVCQVKEDKKAVLLAITHVDGSARVQTVRQEINPRYHKLLTEFGKLSGIPVLLNTSFNIMGEPVVESPYDAVRCFYSTGLDCLVIGNYLITKQ